MQSGGYLQCKKGVKFYDNMKSTKLGHLNAQNPLTMTYLNSFEGHVTSNVDMKFLTPTLENSNNTSSTLGFKHFEEKLQ